MDRNLTLSERGWEASIVVRHMANGVYPLLSRGLYNTTMLSISSVRLFTF